MKKIIGSLRVDERTLKHIEQAIKKHNDENLVGLTKNQFRRLSYELFAQMILQEIKIPVKLQM